jgi:hypothetical protein
MSREKIMPRKARLWQSWHRLRGHVVTRGWFCNRDGTDTLTYMQCATCRRSPQGLYRRERLWT